MKDEKKTKAQLIRELAEMRRRIVELETDEADHVQSDDALKHGEERLQSLIADISDVTSIINADGTMRFVSPLSEGIFGYRPEEVVGKNTFDFVHPDDMPRIIDTYNRGIKIPNYAISVECRLRHKDGSWRTFEIRAKNLLHNPAVQGIAVNYYDITDRKRAEEALQESEQRFRTLAEQSPSMIFINRAGRIVYANDRCEQAVGYTKEEFYSPDFDFLTLMAPESRGLVEANFRSHMRGEDVAPYEYTLLTKDGRRIEAILTTRLIEYEGQPVILGTVTDISERRRAEELFRTMANSSPVGIYIVQDGGFRFVNPRFQEYGRYTEDELMGMDPLRLVYPEDREMVRENAVQMLKGERSSPYEYRFVNKDGEVMWIMETVASIQYRERRATLGNFMDMTERRFSEEEQRLLYSRERETRRRLEGEIEGRTHFTRALVHALRTPLTAMMASSQLLSEELRDETLGRLARNISEGTSNLNRRIDQLLDMSQGETGMLRLNRTPVDPVRMLEKLGSQMRPVAAENEKSLVLELPSSLPQVSADEERLRETVFNLLDNALKWTGRGGRITLRARRDNDNLIVEIGDTGPGIAKQDQQRIFEPYYHTGSGERRRGLGIGLALCKLIVELHGGQIWVDSEVGEGSTFSFSIPLELDA